jgi:hypothetical protein
MMLHTDLSLEIDTVFDVSGVCLLFFLLIPQGAQGVNHAHLYLQGQEPQWKKGQG